MRTKEEILESLKACLNSDCSGCIYEHESDARCCGEVLYIDAENLVEQTEADGMSKAWEAARKLWLPTKASDLKPADIKEMFGTVDYAVIMNTVSPQGALEKIEAWENRLHVGDMVVWKLDCGFEFTGVVTHFEGEYVTILEPDGSMGYTTKDKVTKTGKRVELSNLFTQIGAQS